jgi:hypothetical protein
MGIFPMVLKSANLSTDEHGLAEQSLYEVDERASYVALYISSRRGRMGAVADSSRKRLEWGELFWTEEKGAENQSMLSVFWLLPR